MKRVLYLIIATLLVMGLVLAGCPSNGNGGDTTVTTKAIQGVTPPATGDSPVTAITETAQFTGTVSWSPAHDPFEASTEYTATIELTAKTGYTFDGVSANFFTVSGATATNPADSGVVTAVFPETAAAPAPKITFAVTGPMTFIQGLDHWAGAEMARDEINAAGGVDVGGVRHDIALRKVETNEILDVSGVSGTTALTAVIDEVDFVVGGFRTESVQVYREAAMDAQKLMMNCGAATAALQGSVLADYGRYKYWFKATPYNEVFLVTSCLRYSATVNSVLRATLAGARNANSIPGPGGEDWTADDIEPLRFAILMENAEWCNPMEPYVLGVLPAKGMEHVGTFKCESAATDLEAQLTAISAQNPHVIFTIISGPPGKAYGSQQPIYAPNVFSIGINVEAQDINYHDDTGASYHITLDTWPDGCAVTPNTVDWFNSFVAKTGRYPAYTAATYDAIYAIIDGVEAVSAANGWDTIDDVVSPANIDALIQYIETTPREGVGANTAYYPIPEVDVGGGVYALSEEQVLALYPHVQDLIDNGVYTYSPADWTTLGGHIPHDTVYGPGYQTGTAVQWQEIGGTWKKVAVWPLLFTDPATPYWQLYAAGAVDLYGNWNFQYDGTQSLVVPTEWITAWISPP
ncbi:MAG: ABC transporter substrate-binding protein [Dehalococcoidia bacterium]